ncbi:DUF3108 domain-containing protein [Parabacteroides sp. OttesenSCG-928-G21]|nr:DUF3108 domain-containing protein [Parabacteroides sp. OttesenSCG-928-G21]
MKKSFQLILFVLLGCSSLYAQCPRENNFFRSGEELSYDMYFNYGIIRSKAGSSSLKITDADYNGISGYKMTMLAQTSGLAKSLFSLKDTISCYTTKTIVPLAYVKHALESGDYTIETAEYDYSMSDSVRMHVKRERNGVLRFDEVLSSAHCMYEMMSIVYYARTLDYASMKNGDIQTVSFLSGRNMMNMDIEYRGTTKIKANDKQEYICHILVLNLHEDSAFENKKEAMKVYLSADNNRIPVRIDSQLKIGGTKVVLKEAKGLLNIKL